MPGDEDRRELFDLLEPRLGSRGAALLMAQLPPVGWAELATKTDLAALRSELMGEIRGEMGDLRGEMGGLRGEMGGLRGEMGGLRGEIAELRGDVANLVPKLWAANVATMFGVAGLVLAIATFFH